VDYAREEKGSGGLTDWWHHLKEHLGRIVTNYFIYQWVGLSYKVIHGVLFLKYRFFYYLISGD